MSRTITLAIIFAILGLTSASFRLNFGELSPLWSTWKTLHQKEYSLPAQEAARYAIFVENYKKIVEFNANSGSDPSALKLALNKFGDLTENEFKSVHAGGYLASPAKPQTTSSIQYEALQLPSSIDWRQKGAVTPVKNQQQCGSCWSFSTTGALESLYFITHGKLLTFSEQQIVDCDTQDSGCDGGLPSLAFEYTARAGLETEADYPYTAADGKCKYDASKAVKVNSGQRAIKAKSVSALKAALAVQPVSIGIEADQDVFQFYKSGVVKGSAGCGDNLDHAVLAVGYTTVGGEEAFIVKNSWGTEWGADGYVYLSTDGSVNGGNGVCGILGDPVVPTAEKKEQTVHTIDE